MRSREQKRKGYGKPVGRPVGSTGIRKKVLKEHPKKASTFTLSKDSKDLLNKMSEEDGTSKSELVDRAILNLAQKSLKI